MSFLHLTVVPERQSIRPTVRKAGRHHFKIDVTFRHWIVCSPQITEGYRRPIDRAASQPVEITGQPGREGLTHLSRLDALHPRAKAKKVGGDFVCDSEVETIGH